MANLNVTLQLDSDGYIRAIRAADTSTNQFAKNAVASTKEVDGAFNRLNTATDKLAVGLGKLKGLIVGAALAGLTRSALGAADAIADISAASELSVGKIIELQQALQIAGGEASNAGKFITEFFKSIDEATQGSDKTQAALQKVGVSLKDLATLSNEQLLDKTIQGFQNIQDPADRAVVSMVLFGKSMQGVAANDLAQQMINLRGQFNDQTTAVNQAAELIGNYEQAVFNLRTAFLTITAPMVEFINNISASKASLETLMTLLKGLAIVLAAAFAFTGFGLIIRAIGTIGRGVGALVGAFGKAGGAVETLGGTIARVFGANSTVMKILRGVGGLVAGIGAGVLAAMGLGGGGSDGAETTAGSTQPGTMGAYRSRANSAPSDIPIRVVEPPKAALAASKELAKTSEKLAKELQDQLNAVQGLADGYRRAAQVNMDRMTTEMDILNLTKEQAEVVKGTAEINSRYADQVSALEDKRKGAKAETLALIDKEIENLEGLRTSELDIFNITREKTREYARQQQEIKNIVEQMEQQAEYAREIAEFQNQQGQAVLAGFEQVRAQREALELTGQREQLEKSIQNLRGSDQATIRELFDLENERKKQLEAIQKIQNLPFEGQGGMKQRLQEINDLYDARRERIEKNAAATKKEQDSFATGWSNAGEKFRNNIKTDAEYAAQQMSNFTKGFEDAFVKFVQTGKLSFKDLANSMIADFARIQAQKILTSFMGGGGGGGFFGSIGKIFGFANGGMPPVGVPSLVGERGPELFVPQNAGKIIPNHKLGMGGQSVINNTTEVSYNIQAVDSASFQQLVASDPKFLHAVVEKGRRSLPQGGRR